VEETICTWWDPLKLLLKVNSFYDASRKTECEDTSREAHVGVIGLGYVGLPLAVEFARAGSRNRY